MMMRTRIECWLNEKLPEEFKTTPITVLPTAHLDHGDYYTNLPFTLAKNLGNFPHNIANEMRHILMQSKPAYIKTISVAGNGFLNFLLDDTYLAEYIHGLIQEKNAVTKPQFGKDKRIIIEYSSPNIAKQMGVGHLRSTIIGQALVNMYQSVGYEVISLNHLGDWGTQFGKLLVAYKKWGDPDLLQTDPIGHLQNLYVRFTEAAKADSALDDEARAAFAQLEANDKENIALWKTFREVSLKTFMEMYKRLGTTIEHHRGESDYRGESEAVYQLLAKHGLVKSEGDALILDLQDPNIPTTLLRKSDKSSLYITRDIAALLDRFNTWHPTLMLYVVGQDQSLNFKQLFAVANKLGLTKDCTFVHVGFGLVLLDGKRMRTREGKTILLKDVLDEAVEKAYAIVAQKSRASSEAEKRRIAELVGVGSVKYNDLSQNRLTTISFDWHKMLSLEGNSAPYIMYTISRSHSVLEKAKNTRFSISFDKMIEIENAIARLLVRYEYIISEAIKTNEPSVLASYLYELARSYNTFYATCPIIEAPAEHRESRLALTKATHNVLADGLQLLGIAYPERM